MNSCSKKLNVGSFSYESQIGIVKMKTPCTATERICKLHGVYFFQNF